MGTEAAFGDLRVAELLPAWCPLWFSVVPAPSESHTVALSIMQDNALKVHGTGLLHSKCYETNSPHNMIRHVWNAH